MQRGGLSVKRLRVCPLQCEKKISSEYVCVHVLKVWELVAVIPRQTPRTPLVTRSTAPRGVRAK